ncbi:MAG: right-handed parallel beta-helix repeat-containing protein [Thermoplasmatota archaeon]
MASEFCRSLPPAVLALSMLAFALPPPLAGAQAPEWVVSSLYTLEDTIKDLRASLIIESGGELRLNNATLVMNCTMDAEFEILVKPGGRLTARNSTISYGPLRAHYWFRVRGSMELWDTSVSGTWGVFETGGIVIESSDVTIARCRLADHRWYAISVNGSSPRILNNTIESSRAGIRVEAGGTPEISGNVIRNMEKEGIISLNSAPVIRGNSLLDNWRGVGLFNSPAEVSGNEIVRSGSSGIDCTEGSDARISRNTIASSGGDGVTIYASSPTISFNDIRGNAMGLNCTNSRPVVRGNTITESRDWGVYCRGGSPALESNSYEDGPGSANALGAVAVVWRLSLRVEDSERKPIGGAEVTIRDRAGGTVFSGRTGGSGEITGLELLQLHYDSSGERHEDTPHKVTVRAEGLSSTKEVDMDRDQSVTVRLGSSPSSLIPGSWGVAAALLLSSLSLWRIKRS